MRKKYISPIAEIEDVEFGNMFCKPSVFKTYSDSNNGGDTQQGTSVGGGSTGNGGGINEAKANNLWDFDEEDFDTDW